MQKFRCKINNSKNPYLDVFQVWFAVDITGHIAAFDSCVMGSPAPKVFFSITLEEYLDISGYILYST